MLHCLIFWCHEDHASYDFAIGHAGHLILGKQDVIATIHGSFLCASLEIGMLRRALMYACELRQAKPRALGHPHITPTDPNMQVSKLQPTLSATSSMMMAPDAAQAANARLPGGTGSGIAAGRVPVEASASALQQSKAVRSIAAKSKRNLTVQVFLHCARIDVSSYPMLVLMHGGVAPACIVAVGGCGVQLSQSVMQQDAVWVSAASHEQAHACGCQHGLLCKGSSVAVYGDKLWDESVSSTVSSNVQSVTPRQSATGCTYVHCLPL